MPDVLKSETISTKQRQIANLAKTIAPGQSLPFEVRYLGQPLAGATVHIQRLDGDLQVDIPPLRTGADGRAALPHRAAGVWMLHVVWARPEAELLLDADYQTVFSSLTFALLEQPVTPRP